MDRLSPDKRSLTMSKIRSKNTSPELLLRRVIYASGNKGYRVHYNLPGRPDMVFVRKQVAIFVDGDFWHGYLWKRKNRIPPRKYWQAKIRGNMERDVRINRELRKKGWRVVRLWEHEIKKNPERCLLKIKKVLADE